MAKLKVQAWISEQNWETDECILWPFGVSSAGYGRMWDPENRRYTQATRYIKEKIHGTTGQEAMHQCDVPGCVNPNHLVWGSHAQNMAEMKQRGRSTPGEKNTQSKLTEAQVWEILAAEGLHREIAAQYGVTREAVGSIKRGARWTHVYERFHREN